jgi:2-polyprenyl-3-methyl-5-hydroxy-6-metoxy-1,4-benzoquinol methylase
MTVSAMGVEARARLSLGSSDDSIHALVAHLLASRHAGGVLADVGCGSGALWRRLASRFTSCVALDAVRYDGLPADVDFRQTDLDAKFPVEEAAVDVAAAVEIIEHLENPRAFVRELSRIVRPGGWVVVTTPNQLSLLSLLTLATKGTFSAFQEGDYPAHRTALLEVDLRRIFAEAGLREVAVAYTCYGRLPLSGRHYPRAVAALAPRRFSDNVAVAGRR